jgi:three-Cys-motif partner protein
LTYLEKYSTAFMTAMAAKRARGRWADLIFIDLLCGPGIDIIDGKEHRGSPLIALATVPRFDRLFLNDIDEENVTALRRRVPAADYPRIDLQADDCHSRADKIVKEIAEWGTLGFAFVDPEGFEVRFELFKTLSQRPIDILFLFPSGIGIKRNIERFARSESSPMDFLMGDREWRKLPAVRRLAGETLSQAEAEKQDQSWAQAFRKRVESLGYTHHAAAPPLRNDQNVPMYHLLFFSKHKAGLDIWQGISKIEPDGQRRLWT